jgi:hypothetical protein
MDYPETPEIEERILRLKGKTSQSSLMSCSA